MQSNGKAILVCFALAITFHLAGCGLHIWQPQQVTLMPRLSIAPVNIGGGSKIHITVTDERGTSTNFLGYKRVAGGKITTSEDLTAVYRKGISAGLASLGFDVVSDPDPAAANLEISLVRFLYIGHSLGLAPHTTPVLKDRGRVFGPKWHTSAAATVRVGRGQTEAVGNLKAANVIQKSYEAYSERIAPSPGEIEERVNAVLSELITKLLMDVELLTYLKATGRN